MLKWILLLCCLFITTDDPIWGNATTDQERCQAEAEYMAKHRKLCHVGPCIGNFEGIGWSKACALPNTCTPDRKMVLTGDAVVATQYGLYIRVRSWRNK